jgi:hypothetical protein
MYNKQFHYDLNDNLIFTSRFIVTDFSYFIEINLNYNSIHIMTEIRLFAL